MQVTKQRFWFNVSITNACNFSCKHCLIGAVNKGEYMNEALLGKIMSSIYSLGFKYVGYTGGEPFLDFDKLMKSLDIANQYKFKHLAIISNGWWGKDANIYVPLLKSKVSGLTISYDVHHAKFLPIDILENICNVSALNNLPLRIRFSHGEEYAESKLMNKVIKIAKKYGVIVDEQWLIPKGNAKLLNPYDVTEFSELPTYSCATLFHPIFDVNGDLYICCSHKNKNNSLVYIPYQDDVCEMIKKMVSSKEYRYLHAFGFHDLYEEYAKISDSARGYTHLCDVCDDFFGKENGLIKKLMNKLITPEIDARAKKYILKQLPEECHRYIL